MGFVRDSTVDAEVNERSSQRLRQTPETRPTVNRELAGLSRLSGPAGRSALGRVSRQTPSLRTGPNETVWANGECHLSPC